MTADLPQLRDPVVIAAFEGWNDAGDAATGAVEHLEVVWAARPLAALDPDDYYDFQVNRPTVALADDGTRRISWPTTRLSVCHRPEPERDVVLLRGLEPNMRWRSFCTELLAIVGELGVRRVVTLGALLADTPHTRPVPVSGTSSEETEPLGLPKSRYEGPTGIVGVFQEAAEQAGFSAASFWAAVPHYVAQPPCAKASLALLRHVEDALDVAVPVGELPELAREWERGVNELAGQDSEVAAYVAALEQRDTPAELSEATGDAIVREFERYLRRRGPGRDG